MRCEGTMRKLKRGDDETVGGIKGTRHRRKLKRRLRL
jgi:hypothetical protein